jgi:hypothetical protein
VKEALEAGSKYINERRGSAFNTPLHNAATKSNLEIARLLVEVGASPIQQATPDGTFHVRLGHEVANINARNEIEATPLMFAAGSNQTEMMLYLMDHGADFSLQTESGGTAMHFAVRTNNSELVAAFLDKVAAMNGSMAAPDSTSTTAVEAAVDEPGTTSAMDLVRIVNHANNQGWVPLHFAARQGSAAIAKLLIDRGADMDAVELRGEAKLQIASESAAPKPEQCIGVLQGTIRCWWQQHCSNTRWRHFCSRVELTPRNRMMGSWVAKRRSNTCPVCGRSYAGEEPVLRRCLCTAAGKGNGIVEAWRGASCLP